MKEEIIRVGQIGIRFLLEAADTYRSPSGTGALFLLLNGLHNIGSIRVFQQVRFQDYR